MSDSGYKRSPERQAVVDALLADRRRRLAKLCKRLSIPYDRDYWTTLQLVGWELAQKEPEFGPGRGRPKLTDPTKGIDAQRAVVVIKAAKALTLDPDLPRLSVANWIRELKKYAQTHPADRPIQCLFGPREATLYNSIRRGLKLINYPDGLFTKK